MFGCNFIPHCCTPFFILTPTSALAGKNVTHFYNKDGYISYYTFLGMGLSSLVFAASQIQFV